MPPRITFQSLGGVASGENPTGSCHLLQIQQGKQNLRILVDCGLYQGKMEDRDKKNRELLLDPKKINCIIATHPHIDHIGKIPYLVKKGFGKSIFCTHPSAQLFGIMLRDTADIFEKELRDKLKKIRGEKKKEKTINKSRHSRKDYPGREKKKSSFSSTSSQPEVLYSEIDVEKTLHLVKNGGFEYETWIRLEKGIRLKFYSSGHVLGGAICVIEIASRKKGVEPFHIGFSGDLGREDGIILPPPAKILEPLDAWVIESTYGGKKHPLREEEIQILLNLVREAYEKKVPLIIPSFALERAQEIIYLLSYYMEIGVIPEIPIFLDSPMARETTNKFGDMWELLMFKDQSRLGFNAYRTETNRFLKIVASPADSLALANSPGARIVIAASGMCDHGRIRNHLKLALGNPDAIICLVGFMAEGTLGEKLRQGFPLINMDKQEIRVRAKIISLGSFSAHADGPFLVKYTLDEMKNKNPQEKKIIAVHGIRKGALYLKADLLDGLGDEWANSICIPEIGELIELN